MITTDVRFKLFVTTVFFKYENMNHTTYCINIFTFIKNAFLIHGPLTLSNLVLSTHTIDYKTCMIVY